METKEIDNLIRDDITLAQLYNGDLIINYRVPKMQLYLFVYKIIYKFIITGQLNKGDKLPSENELCKFLGVGRSTVRMAIVLLLEDRLVETIQGKGTFVRVNYNNVPIEPSRNLTIKNYVESTGNEYACNYTDFLMCPYDDYMSEKFTKTDSQIIGRVNRVHTINNNIFCVSDDFFIMENISLSDTETVEHYSEKIDNFILEFTDRMISTFSVTQAELDRKEQLSIKKNQSILLVNVEYFDENNKLLVFSKQYWNTAVFPYSIDNKI